MNLDAGKRFTPSKPKPERFDRSAPVPGRSNLRGLVTRQILDHFDIWNSATTGKWSEASDCGTQISSGLIDLPLEIHR